MSLLILPLHQYRAVALQAELGQVGPKLFQKWSATDFLQSQDVRLKRQNRIANDRLLPFRL